MIGGDFDSPRSGSNPHRAAMLGLTRAAGFGDMLGQVGGGIVSASSTRADTVVNSNLFSVKPVSRHLRRLSDAGLIDQDMDFSCSPTTVGWEMVVDAAGGLHGVVPSKTTT